MPAKKKVVEPLQEESVQPEEAQVQEQQVEEVMPVVASEATLNDKSSMLKLARILLELILLAAVIYLSMWGYGLQSKNKDLQKQVDTLNANPAVAEQRKTNELIGKVSALIQVPTNEAPQAALVSDANALKKQYPFFTDVQNGDQILFYVKAGKVIVYRPSTNKIVQTGPLSVNKTDTAKSE